MSKPRDKKSTNKKAFRVIASSFFHLAFLALLVVVFVLSLDEERIFDIAFQYIYELGKLKYVLGGMLVFYLIVISLHFAEIFIEISQTRKSHRLQEEVNQLKAKIYDLQRNEETMDQEMKAFRDSLDEGNS